MACYEVTSSLISMFVSTNACSSVDIVAYKSRSHYLIGKLNMCLSVRYLMYFVCVVTSIGCTSMYFLCVRIFIRCIPVSFVCAGMLIQCIPVSLVCIRYFDSVHVGVFPVCLMIRCIPKHLECVAIVCRYNDSVHSGIFRMYRYIDSVVYTCMSIELFDALLFCSHLSLP